MFTPLSKVLVLAIMLIAFTGQALAYTTMPCEMAVGSHQSHMAMDHAMSDSHENMGHSKMAASQSTSDDCCELECFCPANACTSVTILNSDLYYSNVFGFSETLIPHTSEQPRSIAISLYRPPIFS